MIRKTQKLVIYVSLILFFCIGSNASEPLTPTPNQYLFLDGVLADYADYLLTSNHIQLNHPLLQPYNFRQVLLDSRNDGYSRMYKEYWSKLYYGSSPFIRGIHIGNSTTNSAPYSYRVESLLGYSHSSMLVMNRTRIFEAFKRDSSFAGDLSESKNWLFGRVHDAFFDYKTTNNHLFIGKMEHNWGPVGAPSLILSNNPYTYNKVLYDYSTPKITLSILFSKLETTDGEVYDYYTDTIKHLSQANKFLTGHRLDINLSDRLKLAFTEMAIYGGAGRQLELNFLNPMELYYGVQRNDGARMSGMWAADVYYRIFNKTLLYAQFLLDDIIINNDPDVNDRDRYPDRLGLYLSLRTADYLLNGLLLDLSYTRIWNRTYQTYSFWENYHYRGKSLGYPHVSSEEIKLRSQFWGSFPHFISSQITVGRYGDAAVTDIFYLIKENFPVAPVTYVITHDMRYGFFKYTQLSLFLNHSFRYQNLRDVNKTTNTLTVDIDYTFLW